ncbi:MULTISPECIES: ferredoxin Fer [Halococcus]|uniref:DnaJ N-terminal domain-containing protein n=1 Tax=Halococcus salifodinae DSM 8989 TaxID=1227456 RepID=M0MUA4_9EURY|nr:MULTISPECIES: ferredoxin Fer [Halococcus]EMA49206.1 DnaJ N-terminal domain-containing protein [Halococcus salifodinae DSM 8989]
MASPFDVLRVEPDASEEAIEQAYRERVIEAHPDHGGSPEEFQRVRTAYKQLQAGYEPEVDTEPELEDEESYEQAGSRVEYLNYAVLDDHGWDLDDDDLFGKAAEGDLDHEDYGEFLVEPHESLLEAAENRGFMWPFACRGGACANCAVIVKQGELSMPVNNILPPEMIEQDIRLSCNGIPVTDEMQVLYNVKHLPELEELRLPPRPFEQAYPGD